MPILRTALAATLALAPAAVLAQGPATGSITAAFAAESTTLDPTRYSAGVDTYFISQMFEQLVRPHPETLEPENWLAESWELLEEDGKYVIDVRLRPNVTFHNGDPMTAEDFEFAYERMSDPAISRWSHLQRNVERFEIVDDLHFRLHFSEPDANYVAGFLQLWAIPKAYFEEVGDEGFGRAPIGTGPFKFVSRTINEELRLEAYDDYWNEDARPGVKNVTIKIIPEDLTRVAAFRTGDVDWIDAVPPAMLSEVEALPGVETTSRVSGNNLFLMIPTVIEGSPLQDVRVRRAIAHAIDVDAIIAAVLFGQGERYVEVGEGSTGYDPDLKPFAYDPAKARELLAEAGYAQGFDVPCYNLTTPREPNVREMGEAMFAFLSQVGIRCQVEGLEYSAWLNLGRTATDTPQLDGLISWMWGHGVPGDPGAPWAGHLHTFVPGEGWGSYSWVSDSEIDAMIRESITLMDPEARTAKLQAIARLKNERVLGGLTTYRPLVTFAWKSDKMDFTPTPVGFWRSLQGVQLKD